MRVLVSFFLLFMSTVIFANESNVYDFSWLDDDKKVYVLQNRKFRKDGRFYIGGVIGTQINGAFIDSTQYSLMAGYFFHEDYGIELLYLGASGETNTTYKNVERQGASVAFYKDLKSAMIGRFMWSPFYSKINTFNKIFYFDWLFGLGLASVSTEDNRNEFSGGSNKNQLTEETNSGINWMTGFHFHANENWDVRMDINGIHVNSEAAISTTDTEDQWQHYYSFSIGLNYRF